MFNGFKTSRKITNFILINGLSLFTTIIITSILTILIIIGFFIHGIYEYIHYNHFFEAIVLICLLNIIFILLKNRQLLGVFLFLGEGDVNKKVVDILRTERIKSVDILSAGLAARQAIVSDILDSGVSVTVRVLAQHPSAAIDKRDGERVDDSIRVICQNRSEETLKRLKIRYNLNTASIRAIILHGERFSPSYAFLSWYIYHTGNKYIKGRGNPTLFVSSATIEGRELIEFVKKLFDRIWNNEEESTELNGVHPVNLPKRNSSVFG